MMVIQNTNIAKSIGDLKCRLDEFFSDDSEEDVVYLQQILNHHFLSFKRVCVIGGLVRDFARVGRDGFDSDVDLVIDAPQSDVKTLAEKLSAEENVFGGFSTKVGRWKIDFWAMENTWAFRNNLIKVNSLEDVINCTFFDWDSVAYDLKNRRVICSENYLEKIRSNILEINLLPNPSPLGNLLRAVRRLILWNARAGKVLTQFIKERLDEPALSYVKKKELELYENPVSLKWKNVNDARKEIFAKKEGEKYG